MDITFAPLLLLAILLFIFIVTVPTLIGVYVYKDASRRGMNATLWALLSAFAPGFVGLVIYLIVRSGYTDSRCYKCGKTVRESFAVCPHCGTSLKEHCDNCNQVLESAWTNCPGCGTRIPEEKKTRMNIAPKKDKGLGRLLLVLILVPLVLCVGLTAITASVVSARTAAYTHAFEAIPTVDAAIAEYPFLEEWIAECDAKGDGTYVFPYEDGNKDDDSYRYFIYRNDGYGIEDIEIKETGLFSTKKELQVRFSYLPIFPVMSSAGSDATQVDYAIGILDFTGEYFDGLRLFDAKGNEIEYK